MTSADPEEPEFLWAQREEATGCATEPKDIGDRDSLPAPSAQSTGCDSISPDDNGNRPSDIGGRSRSPRPTTLEMEPARWPELDPRSRHGLAGDLLSTRRGGPGFLSGEVADAIPEALASLRTALQ